jgi:hypothetical protein
MLGNNKNTKKIKHPLAPTLPKKENIWTPSGCMLAHLIGCQGFLCFTSLIITIF